jgi:Cu+-exporting ATPase
MWVLAMSIGTDVAMHAAGITLMRGDPALVADAIDISPYLRQDTMNLFWAFIYNMIGIPYAPPTNRIQVRRWPQSVSDQ